MRRIDGRAEEILRASPNVHLATLMHDGAPKVEPVWADVEDGRILVATDAATIKAVNVERDSRVALSATATDDPYEQVLVRGVVTEIRDDASLEVLDRLSERHVGKAFPRRSWGHRIVLIIEAGTIRHYRSPLSQMARSNP